MSLKEQVEEKEEEKEEDDHPASPELKKLFERLKI